MEKKLVITLRYQVDADGNGCFSYELGNDGIIACHDLKDFAASLESEALYFGTNTCGVPEPEPPVYSQAPTGAEFELVTVSQRYGAPLLLDCATGSAVCERLIVAYEE